MTYYEKLIASTILDKLGKIVVTDLDWNILYQNGNDKISNELWKVWIVNEKSHPVEKEGFEWDIIDKENGKFFSIKTYRVDYEGHDYLIHYFCDISSFTELYQELSSYSKHWKDESEVDALTGLYNKYKFNYMYNVEFPKYDSIAIFSLDVNYLKRVNDTLGHEAGNQLLVRAANSIKRVLNRNIYGFRIGGDEFFIIAKNIEGHEVDEIYEDWRKELDRLNKEEGECIIACGIVYANNPFDIEKLFNEADELMYADKKAIKLSRGEDPESR